MDNLQYVNLGSEEEKWNLSFKPYYKWITFNTKVLDLLNKYYVKVLNLIING